MVVQIGDRRVPNGYWASLSREEQEAFRDEAIAELEAKQDERALEHVRQINTKEIH